MSVICLDKNPEPSYNSHFQGEINGKIDRDYICQEKT